MAKQHIPFDEIKPRLTRIKHMMRLACKLKRYSHNEYGILMLLLKETQEEAEQCWLWAGHMLEKTKEEK